MYLHLGSNISIPFDDIIAVFDLDKASTSKSTRLFLRKAEQEGMVFSTGDGLPNSLILCVPKGSWQQLYLTPLSPQTIIARLQEPFPP